VAAHAIIIGATGLVGSQCLPLLVQRYESVTAILRRSSGIAHPNLTERFIDFEKLGTIDVPDGAHVYCAMGTTIKTAGSQEAFRRVDFEYPRLLAERASQAPGARLALVSSVGADSRSNNFYLRVKGELEDAVRAMPFEAVHLMRPSFLLGNRAEARKGERAAVLLARAVEFLLIAGLRKYRAIPVSDVAGAMAAAANKEVAGCFIYHYDEMRNLAGENGRGS
jgi:uncharacterized protein YbjT (DUF2867 family)